MIVVRYVALAALVVWLAGLLAAEFGDALRTPLVAAGCGAVVLTSLIAIKFVGPPPRAFVVRAAVVAVILAVALLEWIERVPRAIAVPVSLVLAAILLFWYVEE
jgi:hypothetical protein